VTDPEVDERIVATCAEQMGGIDVLVNNAGTSYARALDELTDDDWRGQ
jgi:3-oxoacyl-[acyl-carrier protein] reductase